MAETKPKPRELGKDSNGDPAIYPSDIESVATQYGLTTVEAERLLVSGKVTEAEANKIKEERVVFRPHYEYVSGNDSSPLAVAERRRLEEERTAEEARKARDKAGPTTDKFSPEAGPYGPNAVYTEVEAPVDTDHTSPDKPSEVAKGEK